MSVLRERIMNCSFVFICDQGRIDDLNLTSGGGRSSRRSAVFLLEFRTGNAG
jgi:hypothetical protein